MSDGVDQGVVVEGTEVVQERATIPQMERYEVLRRGLREAEALMHPAKAHLVDLEALAFIVEALVAIEAGERMPPKPNKPPVARPGRGRGWKPRPGALDDGDEKPDGAEDEGAGA